MKGLVWNCKSVHWKHLDDNIVMSDDCLLVYICCELGDSNNEVREATRRILQLNKKRYLKDSVVIFPFAHMSNEIMDSIQAKTLVLEIATRLNKKVTTSIMGFNRKKEIKIHLLPENTDVSFFCY